MSLSQEEKSLKKNSCSVVLTAVVVELSLSIGRIFFAAILFPSSSLRCTLLVKCLLLLKLLLTIFLEEEEASGYTTLTKPFLFALKAVKREEEAAKKTQIGSEAAKRPRDPHRMQDTNNRDLDH